MKAILLATAVASLALATTANAASFTFGNLVISQISPENPTTFNNDPVGPVPLNPGYEFSTVCDSAYCGQIQFSSDGGVANGTTASVTATPAGDASNYLWGVNSPNPLGANGAEVIFNPANGQSLPNSFNIYWGSIDALMTNPNGTQRYDNTLTVHTAGGADSVTGSQLAAALVFGVNGFGDQFSANDNQWFNIFDKAGPIQFFTASSTTNAFEFDLGSSVPEPSTWAMMMLGFAGLGYAAFRRSAKARALAT